MSSSRRLSTDESALHDPYDPLLSFPWPLRLLFASRPDTLSRCLAVITRAIETGLIQRAGLARASRARTGVVTLIQRFGSALNLNTYPARYTCT